MPDPDAPPRLRRTGWTLALLAAASAGLWSMVALVLAALLTRPHGAVRPTGVMPVSLSLAMALGLVLAALALNGWAVALLARRLNRPLAALSQATLRLRDGEHDTRLDEGDGDPEMRQVHAGFNRVAREIERIEHDRALMLAGLSHDLRTPLARLRLEAELSVPDPQARSLMAADIETLDRLIGKFSDYARPQQRVWEPVPLRLAVEHAAATFDASFPPSPPALTLAVDPALTVMGDPTEVLRVLRNLLQNASRHGRTPGQSTAAVTIRARRHRAWVDLEVRDHGPGVPPAQLARLTVPFFRGDTARTDAPGSGLGLAIVEQAIRRMDGSVQLRNAPEGGLLVQIRLLAGPDAPNPQHGPHTPVSGLGAAGLSAAGRARRARRRPAG